MPGIYLSQRLGLAFKRSVSFLFLNFLKVIFFLSLICISEVMVGTPAAILDHKVRTDATSKEGAMGRESGFLSSL